MAGKCFLGDVTCQSLSKSSAGDSRGGGQGAAQTPSCCRKALRRDEARDGRGAGGPSWWERSAGKWREREGKPSDSGN